MRRFNGASSVANLLTLLAALCLIGGIGLALLGLFAAHNAGLLIGGLLGGVLFGLVFYALGQALTLLLAIEANTRDTAAYFRKRRN